MKIFGKLVALKICQRISEDLLKNILVLNCFDMKILFTLNLVNTKVDLEHIYLNAINNCVM